MKKKSNQTRAGGRILVPKWMMKMKVVFILLVCSLVQVQAAVSARQSKVSVELKNVTLEKVFQELETLDTDDEQIEQFIIYRWNRVYPTDVSVEIGTEWKLTETEEFPGFSHEKITKEIYCRE